MTYELVNRRTTNTLGSFESEDSATRAYEEYAAAGADFASDLVVVVFDSGGEAIESHSAAETSERLRGSPQFSA